MGGTPRSNEHLICRLSRETKQYSIRKQADGRLKHNKHSHGAVQKDLDTLIAISYCHYQRLGLCHYFKALNLFFESFVIVYTCLRKLHFLVFPFYILFVLFLFKVFLFIIVFDVIYSTCMFYALKLQKKKKKFILKSPDIL